MGSFNASNARMVVARIIQPCNAAADAEVPSQPLHADTIAGRSRLGSISGRVSVRPATFYPLICQARMRHPPAAAFMNTMV